MDNDLGPAQGPSRSEKRRGFGLDIPQIELDPRARHIIVAMQRARRVVGPRPLRVVVRTELVSILELLCVRSSEGRPMLDEWELIASPDAAADQMTIFDLAGVWVYSAFVPPMEMSEEGSRVYEGLRRAGYSIPKAFELAASLGSVLEFPTDEPQQPTARRATTLYGGSDQGQDVTFMGE